MSKSPKPSPSRSHLLNTPLIVRGDRQDVEQGEQDRCPPPRRDQDGDREYRGDPQPDRRNHRIRQIVPISARHDSVGRIRGAFVTDRTASQWTCVYVTNFGGVTHTVTVEFFDSDGLVKGSVTDIVDLGEQLEVCTASNPSPPQLASASNFRGSFLVINPADAEDLSIQAYPFLI